MAEIRCRLIILAAGEGKRFKQQGYVEPKPYIDVLGLSMLEVVIRNMRDQLGQKCPATIITQESFGRPQEKLTHAEELENASIIRLSGTTGGAAETALLGINHGQDIDEKIIICNCDQLVLFDGKKMLKSLKKNAGSILTFEDPTLNPKWSYAEISKGGKITRVAEKVPISTHATVGVYGYSSRKTANDAISKMISANDRFNGEFYLCPAYNYIDGTISNISSIRMWGLGTPEDLEAAHADSDFGAEVARIR